MKKRVIIIGGGMAGLSAANSLVRSGCDVTLLEAKTNFGGRIHTIEVDNTPIELGAEFLHGESTDFTNAIKAAGLSTHVVAEDYQIFQLGRFKRMDLPGRMSRIINKVDIRHRDCSFAEFLNTQNLSLADREQAIGFVQGFHAADPHFISAHSLRRGEYAAEKMPDTKQGRINEGYGALVKFLVQETCAHGGQLIANAIVSKVHWQPGLVDVVFHHNDARDVIIQADAAIVTLPLGVLKAGTVEFQPPLGIKREAIEQLRFGNVAKVIFKFCNQWWPGFGFIVAENEVFPTWWTDPRGPVLTGWTGGPKADALLNCSPQQLEKIGLKVLARIFPRHAGTIQAEFDSSYSFNWGQDPCIRGACSYLPVNGLDLPKLLGAPIADTLFFAGEATITDAQTGMVFGAFKTGLRAGREVLAAITGTGHREINCKVA